MCLGRYHGNRVLTVMFFKIEVVLYKRLYHYFLRIELLYCIDRSLTGLGVIASDKNSQALQLTRNNNELSSNRL